MGLFDDASGAFAPFFDDVVSVEGRSGARAVKTGGIPACVFDQGFDDPVSDGSSATERRLYSVVVRVADWPNVEPPRIGFVVTLKDGARLSVKSVARSADEIAMEARTC